MSYPGYPGQQPGAPYQQGGYPGQPGAPQGYGAPQGAPQGYPGAPQGYGAPQQPQGYPGAYAQAPPQQQQYGAAPPPGVSPEVMSWFRAVDQDNSGFINAEELSRALQSGNNRHFSLSACATMIGMFDRSNTGRIDVTQFSQLFAFINQWTEAFKRADSDRSGSIAVNELQPVLQQQGYNISPATVALMVAKYGTSAPPHGAAPCQALGLDGFILVNVQLRKLTDAFRQRDTQQQGRITIGYEEFIGMVVNMV